jgi:DNA-binding Lrp family transcriptional regulator
MEPLLAILQADATTSPESIAKQLNLSVAEVLQQIQHLVDRKIILGYRAIIDDGKTDSSTVKAIIEVKITPEAGGGFDRIAQRIARHNVVTNCYLMSGNYDLLILVEGTANQIATFVSEKLSTIPGVVSTTTHFTLKPYKIQGVLLTEESSSDRLSISP